MTHRASHRISCRGLLVAALASVTLGVAWGAIAGMSGGRVDSAVLLQIGHRVVTALGFRNLERHFSNRSCDGNLMNRHVSEVRSLGRLANPLCVVANRFKSVDLTFRGQLR